MNTCFEFSDLLVHTHTRTTRTHARALYVESRAFYRTAKGNTCEFARLFFQTSFFSRRHLRSVVYTVRAICSRYRAFSSAQDRRTSVPGLISSLWDTQVFRMETGNRRRSRCSIKDISGFGDGLREESGAISLSENSVATERSLCLSTFLGCFFFYWRAIFARIEQLRRHAFLSNFSQNPTSDIIRAIVIVRFNPRLTHSS